MKAIGRDADLRPHSELATICELSRGIVEHDRAVDTLEEALGRGLILRHDRFGMRRAIFRNMRNSGVHAIHYPRRDDRVQVLRVPVVLTCGPNSWIDLLYRRVSADLAACGKQIFHDRLEMRIDARSIDEQR